MKSFTHWQCAIFSEEKCLLDTNTRDLIRYLCLFSLSQALCLINVNGENVNLRHFHLLLNQRLLLYPKTYSDWLCKIDWVLVWMGN